MPKLNDLKPFSTTKVPQVTLNIIENISVFNVPFNVIEIFSLQIDLYTLDKGSKLSISIDKLRSIDKSVKLLPIKEEMMTRILTAKSPLKINVISLSTSSLYYDFIESSTEVSCNSMVVNWNAPTIQKLVHILRLNRHLPAKSKVATDVFDQS
jgi:hypothetical protein